MSPSEQNLVDVVCPSCGEQYHLRREALGRRVECVNKLCRQRFVAEPRDSVSPPLVEALLVDPPPAEPPPAAWAVAEVSPAQPVEALPEQPIEALRAQQAAQQSSVAGAPAAKHRPARKSRRGQPPWAWAVEALGAAAIVVLGAYVAWNQWRRHSADAETDWKSLQADYQEHKWAHARQGFERYAEQYPDSPHSADVPFFVSMCEAGDKVYSPTGDPSRGLEALEKVFRAHRDSAAYRDYAADLFQALGRLVERFTQRADQAIALGEFKQARQAAADVRQAQDAQTLLKTVAQSMKEVWVPERVAKLDQQIGRTEADVRTGLARKEIASLFDGIGRLAAGDKIAGVYEHADRLLFEHAELKDDPQIARARAAAYRSDAGRVRFHADAADSLPTPAAGTTLRVVERGSTTDATGATLAVVWREQMTDRSGPPGPPAHSDSDAVVLSLVDGILYAFDSGGGVRWVQRLGLDANQLPLRLPATASAPETLVVMSPDEGAVIALNALTGEARWSYQPTSPATGHLTLVAETTSTADATSEPARQRVLLPTVDGRIDVIEPVLGKRLGYFETGWPLSLGGAHDAATGLIYFPADSQRIFALDAAAIDGQATACRSVLVTRHASGSLASAPLAIGPYLVLIESADLDRTRLRAFALGEGGFDEPDVAALAEQTVAGWSWCPPLATPERLLLATDQGDLGLFGFNLDNRAEAIYRLIDDGQPSARVTRATDGRALAICAEGRLLWLMAGGRLIKLDIDIVGQRTTRLWEDAPSTVTGGPLHTAQAETHGGRTILYLTTAEGAARRELAAVAADTGRVEWRRMLGVSPIGAPAVSGDSAFVLDQTGGIAVIHPPSVETAPVVNVIEPDSSQTGFGEPSRFMSDRGSEHVLQSSSDGESIRLREFSAEARWQFRRLPSPLAGRPALIGDVLIVPCADGLLHRIAGEGSAAENEQPFHWSDGDRHPQTAELMPLRDKSIVMSDGWRVRRVAYGVDRTIGRWHEMSPPYVSADRLVGGPAIAGDRVFVASAAGALVALAADAPASALRRWPLEGRPTSGPFVRGECVLLVVDDWRLVCIAADSDDERPRWTSTATAGRICGEPQLAGNVLLVSDTSGTVTGIRLTDGGEAWRVELGAGRAPATAAVSLGDGRMLVPLADRTLLVAPIPGEQATDATEPSPSSETAASACRAAARIALRTASAMFLVAAQAAKGESAPADEEEEEEPPLDAPSNGNDRRPPDSAKPDKMDEAAGSESDLDKASDGQASDKAVAGLYDRVVYSSEKGSPRELRIRPYPDWLELPLPATRGYRFQIYSRKASSRNFQQIAGGQIREVERFELRLAEEASRTLGMSFEKLSRPGVPASISEEDGSHRVEAAEASLRKVLAEHDSATQRGLRRGPKWAERVRSPLTSAVFNLELGQIDRLLQLGKSAEAQQACERLADELASAAAESQAALRARFETLLLGGAESAASRADYRLARRLLDQYLGRFADEPGERATRLADHLREEAQRMVRQAEQLPSQRERDALALLDSAAIASPDLRAVDDVRRRLTAAYPIFDCAYAELPTNLLPQTARLPVERQVAALLFESPVRFDAAAEGGPGFAPGLTDGLPEVLPKGRLIDLPHAPPVQWSDYAPAAPHLLTAADLDWSVRLARREASPGFSPAWASLVARAQPAEGRGPFASAVGLTRDYWQPLALLQFPVLPKHRFPQQGTAEEWVAFEKEPVGTGPYRLGHRTDDTLELLANNNYRRAGLPLIRQIMLHRFEPAEAVSQFVEGKVQVVHGLPPEQVNEIRAQGGRVEKLVSPSVWFLGVNHRHAALKNQDLRLAVANAIDRAKILDECFRPSNSSGDHQPLTGPFPRDCWAYNADVPAFDPATAKPLVDEAKRKLGTLPALKLVVRASEPGAVPACEKMKQQCQAAGIELTVVPLSADGFFFQVTVQHDFDLVYWRHDFPDDSYWLGPLLDSDPRARSPGGLNFMGYVPDGSVAEFQRDLLLHKRFADIRAIAHKLHAHLARTATLIPLWQLDTYVAVSDSLAGAKLTPHGLFDDIEHWRRK